MKVVQLRCGFATNSSSTHSVIIMPKGSREVYDHFEYSTSDDPEFGWEFWTAASPEAKTAYADDILSSNLPYDWPAEVRAAAMRSVGARPRENGVDHQSVPALPVSSNGTFFDAGFFEAYRAFLQRPDVVILGGNDNTDDEHPRTGIGKEVNFGLEYDTNGILSSGHPGYTAKELKPGIWCLFSKKTGTRAIVDMRLDDTYGTEPITYDFPLLADVKITDACSMGCAYCAVPGAQVETSGGRKNIENLLVGDEVVSYVNGAITRQLVTETHARDYVGDVIDIELSSGEVLTLTTDHLVLTKRGWVSAGALSVTDELVDGAAQDVPIL